MISPRQALELLREGNRRFVAGETRLGGGVDADTRAELVEGQAPFAVVLGCSDSRVPPELVFDRGPGDLFVIRVAGNLAGPLEIGSVEFAVGELGAPLVVVLGHTGCGAVAATLEALGRPEHGSSDAEDSRLSSNLEAIVRHIRPVIEPLLSTIPDEDPERPTVAEEAVRANVQAEVRRLHDESGLLRRLGVAGDLLVVGALYGLESGEVEFFGP